MPRLSLLLLSLALSLPLAALAQTPTEPLDEAIEAAAELPIMEPALDPTLEPTLESPPPVMEWLRSARPDTVICPFRGRIRYQPGEIECGLIQVPENREVADSRTIELHYVRLAARGKDKDGNPVAVRNDPVLYLTGGPGVPVTFYVNRLKDHGILAQRDLYILEQRGIGFSQDFCPFFEDRNRASWVRDTFVGQEAALMEAAAACGQRARAAGVDLTGYHTFENARDVRALRQALGFQQWNIWGISYGSVLGQAVLKVDPEGVKAMVIDAIVPLDLDNLMRIGHWYARVLDKLYAGCRDQADCQQAWPNLRQRYETAIESVIEQPITLTVPESERYPGGQAYFFQDLIGGLPFSLLYEESNYPALPALMDGLAEAVANRDETLFKALALADTSGGVRVSQGMSLTVRCLDGYVDRAAESAEREYRDQPLLAQIFGSRELLERAPAMCREMGLTPRNPADFAPVQSAVPILVVNGAWDPITPPPLAEQILPGFSNGRYLEFPHSGHGPTRSVDCAGDLMNAFFNDPRAEPDSECVLEGASAPRFLTGYFPTRAVAKAVILLETDRKSLYRHAAWIGVSVLIPLIALLALLGGGLARAMNRSPAPGIALRLLVLLTALVAVTWAVGLGIAGQQASEISSALLLFGLMPWAAAFAWLAPAAGVLGLLLLLATWFARGATPSIRLGAVPVALASISLAVFAWVWTLWPI